MVILPCMFCDHNLVTQLWHLCCERTQPVKTFCRRAALVEAFRRVRCKDDALNSALGGATAAYALVGIHREYTVGPRVEEQYLQA